MKDWLYQLADDELVLGHRDSEWLGLCPDIEGDVAFSSIAQDEVGHAVYFFQLLHELGESDPDTLAFEREPARYRNAVLLERPNKDWLYSIARHYLYDVFDAIRLQAVETSSFLPLAQAAMKIQGEEKYHLLHFETWFVRLGQSAAEVNDRLHQAVLEVWREVGGLLHCGLYEQELLSHGIIAYGSEEMKKRWLHALAPSFAKAGIPLPSTVPPATLSGRLGEHSVDLTEIMNTMSEVYRLEPQVRW